MVEVMVMLLMNDGGVVCMLVFEGVGIVLKLIWDVGVDFDVGWFVCVLLVFEVFVVLLYVVYFGGCYVLLCVWMFVDFLCE